jgi:hypothetical protein
MAQHFRLARRVALLLPLLALLALGTIAHTPPAAAAGPTIRVTKVDDATLRVDGSGFAPGETVMISTFLENYYGGAINYLHWFALDYVQASPNPFPCTPRQCIPSGGTFVYYLRNIPCNSRLTIRAGYAPEVSAQPCFR